MGTAACGLASGRGVLAFSHLHWLPVRSGPLAALRGAGSAAYSALHHQGSAEVVRILEAGLDRVKAGEDMQSERITAILEKDVQDVKTIGISGTPTFFVNGRQLTELGTEPLLRLVQESLPNAEQ